jgi:iron complex outermembrane recepter protein
MKKPFLYFLLFITGHLCYSQTNNPTIIKGKVVDTPVNKQVAAASVRLLDEVEVTATAGQNKSLLYQPASIATLKTSELKRGQGIFLDDAINSNVPGVSMQRRSVSGGQQFNIRGYGNGTRGTRGISSNFDGQGYKVYINGIPVTDAEGITLLDDIDYGSIGNVEIIKGPAGTLYGQAIAGVVNLKMVQPEKERTAIHQDVMVGNYGLQRYTTRVQTATDHSALLVSYAKQRSDGFSMHNRSDKDFVNVLTEFELNQQQRLSTYFSYSNSYDERLGELTLDQYAAKDYSGNIEYIKRNAHSHVTSFRGGMEHTYNFNEKIYNTTAVFGSGYRSDASSAGGWTDKTAVNYGFRSSFGTKFLLNDAISLSGINGIEMQGQVAQTVGYNMKQNPADTTTTPWVMGKPYWVINATTSNVFTVTGTSNLFTEWTLALPQQFSLTAGVGLSHQRISLDDHFNAETAAKPSHYDTSYKQMVSPHIAINKVFNEMLSVYAAYSRGYKAPASAYFFITTPVVTAPATAATGRVNSELKPEVGDQFEIGTKGALFKNRLAYQLSLFHTKFANKMTTVAVQLNNTTTAYSYVVNGGDQVHNGMETWLKWFVVKDGHGLLTGVSPFANLTWSDFNYGTNFKFQTGTTTGNITTTDYSKKTVAGVPKITANVGIDVTTKPGLYVSMSYSYRSDVFITSDGANRSSPYNLLNGKAGYHRNISRRWEVDASFGMSNIGKVQYPLMIFVNQLPDAYIPAPLKPVLFGGLNVKYNFR